MNTIEDRIKQATRAAADSVRPDSVPPLRLTTERVNGAGRGSPQWARWSRWLAPVAAAAAVIVVVAGMVTVRGAVDRGHTPASPGGTSSSIGAAAAMLAGPTVSWYVSERKVPPYYIAITANGNPNFNPSYAVVRATATGATLATIRPSVAGDFIAAATAAAGDRTFVLDEQHWVPPNSRDNQAFQTRSFYLVRLDSSGRPSTPVKLPMTAGKMVTGVALSPDGSKLAIAVQPDNTNANLTEIRVYTLATGALRTWSGIGGIGGSEDDAASISWTADGRSLAFDWGPNNPGPREGTWLLNTTLSGSDLIADSRQAMTTYTPQPKSSPRGPTALPSVNHASPASRPLTCQGDQIATPDGSAVVCAAMAISDLTMTKNSIHENVETAFLEYSTATGKVVRTLGHWKFRNPGANEVNVLWSNSSGSVIIGAIPGRGAGQAGIISGNTFTPLPLPANAHPAFAGVW
jgi:hypothetical protein